MKPEPVKPDLSDSDDVAEMVRLFYRQVAQDDLLGPVFNDVANVDWASHLPKLTLFWCRNLFGTPGYSGNTLRTHLRVHRESPFRPEQFERWLQIFDDTVDTHWQGPNAERAKLFALRVAQVQQRHIFASDSGHEDEESTEAAPMVMPSPRVRP